MLNTLSGRRTTARQLADLAGKKLKSDMDILLLIGECADVVRGMAIDSGVEPERIVKVGWTTPENVFETVHFPHRTHGSTVFAIGNMGGMGAKVAEYFEFSSLHANDRTLDHTGSRAQSLVI